MKKVLLVPVVVLALSLVACSGNSGLEANPNVVNNSVQASVSGSNIASSADDKAQTDSQTAESEEKFTFVYNNIKITPNVYMKTLEKALGDNYKYFESPSCAYIGLDKVYVYDDFSIYTYPDDKGEDRILQIILTTDNAVTQKGIHLGSSSADVVAAYGDGYRQVGSSYEYTLSTTSLQFLIEEDQVVSIQYWYLDGNNQ